MLAWKISVIFFTVCIVSHGDLNIKGITNMFENPILKIGFILVDLFLITNRGISIIGFGIGICPM